MRMLSIFFALFIVASGFLPVFSQQKLIALHHQGSASFYTSLTDAYNAAVNGDTLYLPGGNFQALGLGKSLTLIGVGHHPDSTGATGATVVDYLNFHTGSDGSAIIGISFNQTLNSYDNQSNIFISRCFLMRGLFFHNLNQNSGWIIIENWIGQNPNYAGFSIIFAYYLASRTNFLISNNVIQGSIGWNAPLIYSNISNNIFLENAAVSADNSTFSNNIFSINQVNSTNSQWYNNLNAGVNGISGTNIGSGNYLDNIPLETVFINYSPSNTFYQNDFHVVNPAYIGNDGAPIGIYGGPFPWKEGSLPFNPHIRSKVISSVTNPDGTIHVNVEVEAQKN